MERSGRKKRDVRRHVARAHVEGAPARSFDAAVRDFITFLEKERRSSPETVRA